MFAGCEETYEGGGNNENGGSGGIFYNDCYCTISSDMVSVSLYTESEPTIVNFELNLNSTTSKSISAGGIGTTLQSYTISITKPSMATEAYVSSTSNATSGSTSASFTYGTTVYGFAKTSGSPSEYDLKSAGWTQIHSTGQYN
jgi:hypothetical protein